VLSIAPTFNLEVNVAGVAQLQTLFDTILDYNISISNLQFTYPSNFPPATVSVKPSSAPFLVSASPVVNSSADVETNVIFELLLNVSAFSQSVELSVTHNLGYDSEMQATPVLKGNNEEICVDVVQTFSVQVANSGPFFQAFRQANSLTVFQNGVTVISNCSVAALGPAPPSTRRARSPLHSRDSVSRAPVGAIPLSPVLFQGMFP